jgi:hypothetical protein
VLVEIKEMTNRYAVKHIDPGQTETNQEPKKPGCYVKPNDDGVTAPRQRWE